MKQKYVILRNNENDGLIIREYAELDKEIFSLLCENAYDHEAIKSAVEQGGNALISALRRANMYPIGKFAEKIAEAVVDLYADKNDQPIELLFDDIDMLSRGHKASAFVDYDEDDSADIDELLDEGDSTTDYDDNVEMKKISSPIKVAEDDSIDLDDEV